MCVKAFSQIRSHLYVLYIPVKILSAKLLASKSISYTKHIFLTNTAHNYEVYSIDIRPFGDYAGIILAQ